MNVTRILVADDHALVRNALKSLLQSRPGWRVCGEAGTGQEAVDRAKVLKPDLVILDLIMPVTDGFYAAREISKIMPAVPILMYTEYGSSDVESQAKRVGVRRMVSKSDSLKVLLAAIESVLNH